VRARQVARADRGFTAGGLKLFQQFERLGEFFRRRGRQLRPPLSLSRCTIISFFCCTIISLLRRENISFLTPACIHRNVGANAALLSS